MESKTEMHGSYCNPVQLRPYSYA